MYRFRLQSVLDHRQLIEDNIKKELAESRQRTLDQQAKLEALIRKEMDTTAKLKQQQSQGMASDEVIAYHAFLRNLSQRIATQQHAVDEVHAQESAIKEALLEAVQKRQILERLKEQGMERYHQKMMKKEQSFIDEIAVNQFVRSTLKCNGNEE